jgi:hypothetical protein
MIVHEQEYVDWIVKNGVGANDRVASSPGSYVSYLRQISLLLGADVSPETLSSENDVLFIARKLKSLRASATIRNYKSAMRQYVAMIASGVTATPFRT